MTFPRLHYVEHVEGEGERLYDLICSQDMEDIVAKPKDSLYHGEGRRTPWIKIKNPNYSQSEDRGDIFQPPA